MAQRRQHEAHEDRKAAAEAGDEGKLAEEERERSRAREEAEPQACAVYRRRQASGEQLNHRQHQ